MIPAMLLATQVHAADMPTASARAFFELWKLGERGAMYDRLTESWRAKWAFADFERFFAETPIRLLRQASSERRFSGQVQGRVAVMRWEVSFAADGKIAGMLLTTDGATVEYPAKHDGDKTPVKLAFPLPGGDEWLATGAHHKTFRSQRFALDLSIVKEGKTYAGSRAEAASYFAYGKPVAAPCGGAVVAASDGAPDAPIAQPSPESPLGNHVILKCADDFYVALAHLKPGGVKVKAGDAVKAGQPLGEVGSSGHSTEPHLHLEAFDALPRETADAWPLVFSDVARNGARQKDARAELGDALVAPR